MGADDPIGLHIGGRNGTRHDAPEAVLLLAQPKNRQAARLDLRIVNPDRK
jgi:hypothetical protein